MKSIDHRSFGPPGIGMETRSRKDKRVRGRTDLPIAHPHGLCLSLLEVGCPPRAEIENDPGPPGSGLCGNPGCPDNKSASQKTAAKRAAYGIGTG